MRYENHIRESVETRRSAAAYAIRMTEDGLVGGFGTALVRRSSVGRFAPLVEMDADRLVALLSVIEMQPISINDVVFHVEAASKYWAQGDKCLANLRLMFAELPRVADYSDALRLSLAGQILDSGFSPALLMQELWPTQNSKTFNPDEPRVRFGPTRGQWTSSSHSSSPPPGIVVAEGDQPPDGDDKGYEERERVGVATPEEEIAHGRPIDPLGGLPRGIGPGPYAKESVPAGPGPRPARQQQSRLNTLGRRDGCHTCGTTDPGTTSGNFVGDHQRPNSLNPNNDKQYYFPQCLSCSRAQGGRIKSFKAQKG